MTSNPDAASVALVHRGRVLLIQRTREPYNGLWTLPGGRLEPGEDAQTAAAREVKEELGLTVYALRAVTRLTLGDDRRFTLQVFATEAFEGEIAPSIEIGATRWVGLAGVASIRVTPHLPDVVERALRMFDRS
jgi:8-oxo-dGTP diphosphatase